jgi:hypothetical protein
MEKLRDALAAAGIARSALAAMGEAQIKQLAKALNIDVASFLPRDVRIETGKNGARYVVTEGYPVPKMKDQKIVAGERSLAKNLYLRIESIDAVIEDLLIAKSLLNK